MLEVEIHRAQSKQPLLLAAGDSDRERLIEALRAQAPDGVTVAAQPVGNGVEPDPPEGSIPALLAPEQLP
ncbi:MAG: hypothetical protein ACYDBU_04370 [Vulcanimicrobiaceae bacterium]